MRKLRRRRTREEKEQVQNRIREKGYTDKQSDMQLENKYLNQHNKTKIKLKIIFLLV